MVEVISEKHDSLPVAIYKVLKDDSIDDKTKLERIETYIDVHFDNEQYKLLLNVLK